MGMGKSYEIYEMHAVADQCMTELNLEKLRTQI